MPNVLFPEFVSYNCSNRRTPSGPLTLYLPPPKTHTLFPFLGRLKREAQPQKPPKVDPKVPKKPGRRTTKPTFGGTKAPSVYSDKQSCEKKNTPGIQCKKWVALSEKCIPGLDRARKECNSCESWRAAATVIISVLIFVHF